MAQQQGEQSAQNIKNLIGLGGQQPSQPTYVANEQPQTAYEQPTSQLPMRRTREPQQAVEEATSILQNPAFRKLQEQQQGAQLQQQQLAQSQQPMQRGPTPEQQAIAQNQAQQAQEPSYKDKLQAIQNRKRALASTPGINKADRLFVQNELNNQENALRREEEQNKKLGLEREKSKEKRESLLKKELDTISKTAERAAQDVHALEQIKAANDTGTLIQGPKRKLLERYGLQDFFTNTSTQYVAKQIERMTTGAGLAFGTGRLTNFLAEAYSKGLPRLVNTKEGMDLITKNVILEKKAEIALNDEIRKIKREYNEKDQILPFDIVDRARERIQPKLDTYAQESINTLEAALAKQNNKGFLGSKKSVPQKESFNTLPNAADYSGRTITDTQTGIKYKSNGTSWD